METNINRKRKKDKRSGAQKKKMTERELCTS